MKLFVISCMSPWLDGDAESPRGPVVMNVPEIE
jgi:hypothetical protein